MRLNTTGIAPVTFIGSGLIALGLIFYAVIAPDAAAAVFSAVNAWIIAELGWFYMLSVGVFVIFLLGLTLSQALSGSLCLAIWRYGWT